MGNRRAFIAAIMALATASAGLSPMPVAAGVPPPVGAEVTGVASGADAPDAAVAGAGAARATGAPAPDEQLESAYLQGVRNAAIARPDEISDALVAIADGNPNLIWNADHTKLLVVTWKSESSYERFIKPATQTSSDPANVIWVSAVPQVQRFCEDFLRSHPGATQADLELRLKQYLGLDPNWQYDVFVTLWVSPDELFRPCVDPAIDDSSCGLTFAAAPPVVKGIPNYPAFYKNLYYMSYRFAPGVPWTGLGYTYDWGDPLSPVGASEFIMDPGAAYRIEAATPTAQYCRT